MINWIIYDVVNIFSMKTYKYLSKLRVDMNWYTGVNWSTTTRNLTLLIDGFGLFHPSFKGKMMSHKPL